MTDFRRWVVAGSMLASVLLTVIHHTNAQDRNAGETDELAPPWELSQRNEGEPRWAPLLRIRALETDYRDSRWWGGYLQIRAQEEAAAGNHAAALRDWDAISARPDSVGALAPGVHATDAIAYLGAVADTARIIMVNERHHAASDRLLTLQLLPILRAKGFRYFAAETFSHKDTTLSARGYPVGQTGVYTGEPVFAAIVREALALGYTLVPYEQKRDQNATDESLTPQQRRDFSQAQNLYESIFAADPDAKVLIHAGYSHILERKSERFHPMALYLRELAGIDPVTVDQTRLSERSEPAYEHPAYRAAIAADLLDRVPVVLLGADERPVLPADFAVDIQVLTPRTTYTNGRPDWMSLGGRRERIEVAVPECRDRWCWVEARVPGEDASAIALDGTEVQDTEKAWLFISPTETVVIQVFDETGARLRTTRISGPAAP